MGVLMLLKQVVLWIEWLCQLLIPPAFPIRDQAEASRPMVSFVCRWWWASEITNGEIDVGWQQSVTSDAYSYVWHTMLSGRAHGVYFVFPVYMCVTKACKCGVFLWSPYLSWDVSFSS